MPKKAILTGTWKAGSDTVSCKVPLIIFREEDVFIVYCPALDLSGYGNSENEADSSFKTTLSEYFRYTVNKKTLAEDLQKHGWKLKKNFSKGAIPPTVGQLLETNEDFNRIFNTYDFRKTETTVEIPAI